MILVLVILLILYYTSCIEHFDAIDNHYLDFLENINNSIHSKTKALDLAFNNESSENQVQLNTMNILMDNTPPLYKHKGDDCDIKADALCQHTNPYQYLPNRFALPVNKVKAKETDLYCWTSMYNCCKKNEFK